MASFDIVRVGMDLAEPPSIGAKAVKPTGTDVATGIQGQGLYGVDHSVDQDWIVSETPTPVRSVEARRRVESKTPRGERGGRVALRCSGGRG